MLPGAVASEGKIVQRADIQPVSNSLYMALKKCVKCMQERGTYELCMIYRKQIQQAEKTKFTVQHLTEIRSSYKPVSMHKEEVCAN